MTLVHGLTRDDRRMLLDEARELRAELDNQRTHGDPTLGTLERVLVMRALRERLEEIEEEMSR